MKIQAPARLRAHAALAATVLAGAALALAPTAHAATSSLQDGDPGEGQDNIATTSASIVIASADEGHSIDALSAAPLASCLGTGVILTSATTLSPALASYLRDVYPIRDIYVIGGDTAISASEFAQIKAADPDYNVERIGGTDRYDTSRRVTNVIAVMENSAQRGGGASPTSTAAATG